MRPTLAWTITAVTAMALVALAQEQPATPPTPAAPKSAAPTLDELLNIPAPKSGPKKSDDMLKPESPVKVADDAGGDPFEMAVLDMKQAATRLGEQADSGLDTQRVQERAIRRLDQLINQLNQQQKNQKGGKGQKQDTGSKKNQSQPQSKSGKDRQKGPVSDSNDQGERKGDIENGKRNEQPLTEKLAEWGNLPPRLRDQLLQGMEDRFSTIYKQLTERYYKRLAEESQP